MDLSAALNSINFTKQNLVRKQDGSINESEAKSFPSYIVLKSLSYHADCVPYVSYLAERLTKAHNMSNEMQYEFLLHTIPKGKRFAKWAKPKNEKAIELLMDIYHINHATAKGYLRLLSDKDIATLMNSRGGRL